MSAANSTGLPEVQSVLQRARRQILLHNGIAGLATLLTIAVGYLLLATTSDLLLGLPGAVRAGTLLLFVSLVGYVVWKSLVRPLNTRLPVDELGAAVDLSCPQMQEGLSTLISVQRADASSSEAGSELMRRQLQQQVHQRLTDIGDASFVDAERLKKRCGMAGLAVVAALIPLLAWPSGSQLLLQRFAQPFANLSTVSNLYFDVENGNRVVARGTDAVIRATALWRSETAGERPEEVWLKIVSSTGASDRLAMSFDEVSGQFTATLSQIEDTVDYSISGGGVHSESFRLTVVDAPELTSAVLTATPPPYAGRPVESFEGMVEQMNVFERSRMRIQLQFNKPVASAALVWTRRDERPLDDIQLFDREFDHITGEEIMELDPDAPLGPELPELVMRSEITLAEDGRSGQLDLTADVGGDFHFELKDAVELTNADYLDRTLAVIYDQPPVLEVTGADNLERYRRDDIVPVNARARDDIGIGALELHYYVNDQAAVIVPAGSLEPGSPTVAEAFRLKMSQLQVEDGDVVRIRIRCLDERPEPAPHEVWSEEVNIEIDRNAPPPAARAMEQETQKIIEGLKELERQLAGDQQRTTELQQDARDGWSDDGQEQAQRLSEKQQQQGRVMELIASQVATHPLMEQSASDLRELSPRLSQDIPDRLETAAAQQRNLAADSLRRAESELQDVRDQLGRIISDIEQRAELEKDLAELNRLALEAEDIADRADQLKSDREQQENKPEETTDQDWEQQLNDRTQQLSADQSELTDDIEDLLNREQELLRAAQQAQMSRLEQLQKTAGEIGAQQQRIADAADAEADQVGREMFRAAEQLAELQRQASQMEADDVTPPAADQPKASQQIEDAARQLQQGNLDSPQKALETAQQIAQDVQQRTAEAAEQATGDRRQQLEQQSEQAADLSQKISDARQALQESGAQRTFNEQAAQQPDSQQQQAADSATQLLERLDQLSSMAQSQAEQISQQRSSETAEQASQQTAAQSAAARDSATAGQFEQSAQQLRRASTAAAETAGELRTGDAQQSAELSSEVESLQRELTRTADMLDGLQPQSRAATRQSAQNEVSRQTAELPEQLSELSERMQLEALQMPQQAQAQTSAAAEQAQQASQQSSQAAAEMQNAEFRQAAESGQQAADQLQQIAGTPGESSSSSSQSSMVPEDVGESVADALQNLRQAAEAMQQEGGQPQQGEGGDQNAEQGGQGSQPGQSGEGQSGSEGQSQPGEGDQSGQAGQSGQSGQGQPSADALNSAAKSLAQAASNALPGQFNPNQSQEQQQAGADGMGNPASWDGLLPDRGGSDVEGSRDWGRIVDELDSETLDNARVTRDSTYESLIRMYFRELARSAEK